MKKRIQIILFLLVTSLFVLALAVSASAACTHTDREVTSVEYGDYTQKGKIFFACPSCSASSEEVAPLLKIKGYSVSDSDDGLCTSYDINNKVLSEIAKLNPSFDLGLVAGSKSLLGDKMPLDGKTGAPTDLSQYGASVIKASALSSDYSEIDMKICGFDSAASFEQLYLSAYVYDGNSVKYVQAATTEKPQNITLVSVQKQPEDIKINDAVFSLFEPSTTVAPHRQGQMEGSKADYNKGTLYTQEELNNVKNNANVVVLAGIFFPNASAFMSHYLGNSGKEKIIDMGTGRNGFFKSNETKAHRTSRISDAMRAAEQLAIEGGKVNIYQKTEQVNHFNNTKDDWRLAVGSYFTCIEMQDVTVTVGQNGTKTYSAKVIYTVTDFYNWDEAKTWAVNSLLDVSEKDLHQLHKAGIAKEFTSKGVATYNITWTEGQTADEISSIK